MVNRHQQIKIPPTDAVRERLGQITAEGRILRKLLRIAKSRDQADNQSSSRNHRDLSA